MGKTDNLEMFAVYLAAYDHASPDTGKYMILNSVPIDEWFVMNITLVVYSIPKFLPY